DRYVFIDLSALAPGVGAYANPVATAAATAANGVYTPVSDFGPFPSSLSGRNIFRAPGNWNLDAGIYKTIKLTERMSMQVRAEFYNLPNHANLYVSKFETDVSSLLYVPASFDGSRRVQLGVKLIF